MDLKSDWIKGADISSLPEVEAAGGRFYDLPDALPLGERCPEGADEGKLPEQSALEILKNRGVNLIRLRLWNDPYDEHGRPYGAGTNDLPRTAALARRCKALELPWLLDFHYSDFWADPGKQFPPKAWKGLDAEALAQAVYDYTFDTLQLLKREGLMPAMVAVGNEISNGLLWPVGQVPNWADIARLVSAGIRAVRAVDPGIKTMLHLDNGGWYGLYRSWFDSYFINGGADFDCIGLSWYPVWHGKLEALQDNLHKLAGYYGKPTLIAETAAPFTLEECCGREGLRPDQKKGLAANPMNASSLAWPASPEGQSRFLRDLWSVIRSTPKELCRGFIWWEPAWLPVPGAEWSKPAGLAYTQEKGPGGNEWANQCLFDYDGKALPALRTLEELR